MGDDRIPQPMYWNISDEERFYQAFELASCRRLLINLLYDLLTEKEMERCILRLKAACLLNDGASYTEIAKVTKLSPTIIARLSKQLQEEDSGFSEIIQKFLSKGGGQSYFD
jgi:uncharacterized protein YerC